MDTKDVKTVKMHGPSLSKPGEIVERDVPVCDVQAFRAAGYVEGGIPDEIHEDGTPKVTYTEADAAAQAEVKPKGKGKK